MLSHLRSLEAAAPAVAAEAEKPAKVKKVVKKKAAEPEPEPEPAKAATAAQTPATAPTREWLQAFEKSPKVQRVFALLAEHGSISEVEVAAILGPREFRQFALKFKEHAAKAPFEIRVEPINNVKTYVREGTAQ